MDLSQAPSKFRVRLPWAAADIAYFQYLSRAAWVYAVLLLCACAALNAMSYFRLGPAFLPSRDFAIAIAIALLLGSILYAIGMSLSVYLVCGGDGSIGRLNLVQVIVFVLILAVQPAWILFGLNILPKAEQAHLGGIALALGASLFVGLTLFSSTSSQGLFEWLEPLSSGTVGSNGLVKAGKAIVSAGAFHKALLWDVWNFKGVDVRSVAATNDLVSEIRKKRSGQYSDELLVRVFQESCTTPEAEPLLVGQSRLFSTWNPSKPEWGGRRVINILDIGGAEGRFATRMIGQILKRADGAIDTINVLCIEKGDWEAEYGERVKECIADQAPPHVRCNIDYLKQGFEDRLLARDYDFIFAAHSLYSIFDSYWDSDDWRAKANKFIQALYDSLSPGGMLVLCVASASGASAKLKGSILTAVFGRLITDLTSSYLADLPILKTAELVECDTLFTFPLGIDSSVSEGRILQWLSYFTRVPLGRDLSGLVQWWMLIQFWESTVDHTDLTASERSFMQSSHLKVSLEKARLLRHKTVIHLLSKK